MSRPSGPPTPPPHGLAAWEPTSTQRLDYSARGATLSDLIEAAYALENYQISGGPGWAHSARFDVQGKPPGAASHEQMLLMLRPLLEDRFKLAFHGETKELAVYAMVAARGGPRFKRAQPRAGPAPLNRLGRNVDMAWLAKYLTRFGSDMPVLDRTGLAGNYDLDLDMQKIMVGAGGDSETPSTASVFHATVDALEALGIKLEPAKASVEVLVLDRAERPSAN